MMTGFQKWKEDTNTLSSNRHLDHYKCLFIPEQASTRKKTNRLKYSHAANSQHHDQLRYIH